MADQASPWPDLAGRLEGAGHVLPVRVYFEDTDFSGAVYHASYLRYFERGRSDFLRLIGIAHLELAEKGLTFAVRRMSIDFERGARIDEVLEVRTAIAELSGARAVLYQSIRRGEEVVTIAEVTVVLVDAKGRPRRFPAELHSRLSRAGRIQSTEAPGESNSPQ